MLFRNALETKDPIRVIVGINFSLLPFTLPQHCAYAFLGIFYVVKFEVSCSMFRLFNVSCVHLPESLVDSSAVNYGLY